MDEDWLVLSTIHSAKGLEWDVVCLIHAADGCLPSDMATGTAEEIGEERRLAYVALTRAKESVYVLWPLRYYHAGKGLSDAPSYAQLSRFFSSSVRESMDQDAEARPPGPEDRAVSGRVSGINERIIGA